MPTGQWSTLTVRDSVKEDVQSIVEQSDDFDSYSDFIESACEHYANANDIGLP